jgi:transposase-like protein DUF772
VLQPLQLTSRPEYLIRDRLSFMRFLDLKLEDAVPDTTTICAVSRGVGVGRTVQAHRLTSRGRGCYIARGGHATVVSLPKQQYEGRVRAIKTGKC